MKIVRHPPKIQAKAAFIDRQGRFKASGTMSAIPWNPFPVDMCREFRVSFNHEYRTVQLVEANPNKGWVAEAVSDLEADLEEFPRVRLT